MAPDLGKLPSNNLYNVSPILIGKLGGNYQCNKIGGILIQVSYKKFNIETCLFNFIQ